MNARTSGDVVVGAGDRHQLGLGRSGDRPVGHALERQPRDRGRHQRHADPRRHQADDRQHLGRVLERRAGGRRAWPCCSSAGRGTRAPGRGGTARAARRRAAAAEPGAAAPARGRPGSAATVRSRSTTIELELRPAPRSAGGPGRRRRRPALDQPQLLGRRALVQLDLDVGRRGAEPLHDPGHDREQRRADEVDAQLAGLTGVDPARGGRPRRRARPAAGARRAGTPRRPASARPGGGSAPAAGSRARPPARGSAG